jgi:hypothetical protein
MAFSARQQGLDPFPLIVPEGVHLQLAPEG